MLRKIPAPKNLSPEAAGWWDKICAGWVLDDAALLVLQSGLEALDRMRQAQRILLKEGITCADRFGQRRPNPATFIERDSRTALLRAFKSLDLAPPSELDGRPGRKPGH